MKQLFFGLLMSLAVSLGATAAVAPTPPPVIPIPQKLEMSGPKSYLPDRVAVEIPSGLKMETAELNRLLTTFELTVSPIGADFAFRLKNQNGLDAQSYRLEIDDRECVIRASTPTGFFYGIQTLKQLIDRDDKGVYLRQVKIEDRPVLPVRGVYLGLNSVTVTPESMQRIKDLFYAMAELKINTLFLEFSNNVKYNRQHFPKSEAHAFSREQVKELAAYARDLHMEVIPYLQTLSHCPWILANPDNARLLEDPKVKSFYSGWCPNNPETKAFIKDVIEETIELIHPRYFHIAVDEVPWCSFRKCPKCAAQPPSKVLKQHIMDMYSLLKAQGVKTVMWHDQLIEDPNGYNEGTQGWKIVDSLPRDILINVWIYGGKPTRMDSTIAYFRNKNFQVIGGSFLYLDAVQSLSKSLESHHCLGNLMTYWYLVSDWGTPTIAAETMAMTTALAMYGWNPTQPELDKMHFDPVAFMASRWFKTLHQGELSRTTNVALPFNRHLGFRSNEWPGLATAGKLSPLPEQLPSRYGTFNLGPADGNNVVAVSGAPDDGMPRAPINIPIYLKAQNLTFLHACGIPRNNETLNYMTGPVIHPLIGLYTVLYEDRTTQEIQLRYRDRITSWNDRYSPLHAETVYTTETSDHARFMLSAYQWQNPHPEKTIVAVTLKSLNYQQASFALLALNVGNKPQFSRLLEGFRYSSPAEFFKRWVPVVGPGNLANQATYAFTPAVPGKHDSSLTITVPKVGKRNFIKLDMPFQPDPVLTDKSIAFQFTANRKCQIGLYLGDHNYQNYRVGYSYIHSQDDTADAQFTFNGMLKEGGNIAFNQIKQIRLSIYLDAADTPTVIKIGALHWTEETSDVRLNHGSPYREQ